MFVLLLFYRLYESDNGERVEQRAASSRSIRATLQNCLHQRPACTLREGILQRKLRFEATSLWAGCATQPARVYDQGWCPLSIEAIKPSCVMQCLRHKRNHRDESSDKSSHNVKGHSKQQASMQRLFPNILSEKLKSRSLSCCFHPAQIPKRLVFVVPITLRNNSSPENNRLWLRKPINMWRQLRNCFRNGNHAWKFNFGRFSLSSVSSAQFLASRWWSKSYRKHHETFRQFMIVP